MIMILTNMMVMKMLMIMIDTTMLMIILAHAQPDKSFVTFTPVIKPNTFYHSITCMSWFIDFNSPDYWFMGLFIKIFDVLSAASCISHR